VSDSGRKPDQSLDADPGASLEIRIEDTARQLSHAKRGRPSRLTEERQAKILEALRAGNYLTSAAALAGVSRSTLHAWRQEHPHFADAVDQARAHAEARNDAIVQMAARTQWQAAAWWLERSFPDRWGRRGRIEHDHGGGVGITLSQLVRLADALCQGDREALGLLRLTVLASAR
jgi:transposase-like protein